MCNFNGMLNRYIVIEGNIGAGKTTLAEKVAKDLGARLILESFKENPFLPKFYSDPQRYAFPLELSFLAARYKQLKSELKQGDLFNNLTIADYYLMKSFIFAKITLSDDEFQLYRQFFDMIRSLSAKPDVMFYIHRDVNILKNNIMQRGRSYEVSIEKAYLSSVTKSYFDYFKEVKDFPVVILDASYADFHQYIHYKQFIGLINKSYPPGVTRVKIV
ncbi:Deoxyadenosine/deoxycytidine kinase [Saccharicrinis carchari]|uniref:Deoxyadenosine/deoxycytidine kinase n=1 Tax=Saccharicrinis carchari TaxID=1168039 RepID=A0A521ACU7_SACCC|nr:deoxynucleoside kinase [Saccharicrinis carchari]SMO32632.1 Deoxyadenosine/deoxycytidine kinase [Saccharicrinis carchari]